MKLMGCGQVQGSGFTCWWLVGNEGPERNMERLLY